MGVRRLDIVLPAGNTYGNGQLLKGYLQVEIEPGTSCEYFQVTFKGQLYCNWWMGRTNCVTDHSIVNMTQRLTKGRSGSGEGGGEEDSGPFTGGTHNVPFVFLIFVG